MTARDHQCVLSAAVFAAQSDQRKLDCREVCHYCRDGRVPVRLAPSKWSHWHDDVSGLDCICRASAIWEQQWLATEQRKAIPGYKAHEVERATA